MIFPQLALGGGYQATLLVTSKTAYSQTLYLWAFSSPGIGWVSGLCVNGQAYPQGTVINVSLGPRETKKLVLTSNPPASSSTQTGWMVIGQSASPPYSGTLYQSYLNGISIAYFYQYYAKGTLTNSTGTVASEVGDDFVFPAERDESTGTDTGIAWVNTSGLFTEVKLYDARGNQIGDTSGGKVTGNGHHAMFISELFSLPSSFKGSVEIIGSSIALEVIRIDAYGTGFLLTSTPAHIK